MTLEEFNSLINGTENERNEFKAARSQFSFDNLCEYCIAIANERGGKLILGVTDARPACKCRWEWQVFTMVPRETCRAWRGGRQ